MYADDTVISKSGQHIGDITLQMEEDLRALDTWFRKNKLTLNAKKTNYMIFGLRSCLKNIVGHKLNFGNKQIDRTLSMKYLGITLDPVLNFNMHAEFTCKKVVHKVHLMARLKDSMEIYTRLNMFKTMVLPYADYGDIFYDVARKGILEKLQIVQNKALRMSLGLDHMYPTLLTHQQAGISRLEPRRNMHLLNFMYKQQSNLTLVNNREVYTRAHDATIFLTIKPKNETCKKSALYRGAMSWNALNVPTRNIPEFEMFKLNRKKWLCKSNYTG